MQKLKIVKARITDIMKINAIRVDDRAKFDNPIFIRGQKPAYTTWHGLKPYLKFLIKLHNDVYFFYCGSELVGLAVVKKNMIEGFYIVPERRNMGFGTEFMRRLLDKLGKKEMLIGARYSNKKAIRFYKKCGFKPEEIILKRG